MNNAVKNLLDRVKDFALHACPTRARQFAVDNWEVLSGQRDRLTPPSRLQGLVGDSDFRATGEEFVNYFLRLGRLQPWHRVLDVGCGYGRMAAPLTRVLDEHGRYDGVDVVRAGVDWCSRNIHRRFKSFRFHHADLTNSVYNPTGEGLSHEYTFPFVAASYDFVFLTSVFTHMLPKDVEHYLAEIHRVLKPGGRALVTFFLLNEESSELIAAGRSAQSFVKYKENIYVTNPQILEAAVGYQETWVRKSIAAQGFSIVEPIHFGSWSGRDRHLSYQDIVILTKKA